ncbi:MAG: DUF362 domain-containing protein [Proteobacteria bacterium]|nr:DUF362 domain-containing protein [Pseudomonadota bacterium]
MKLSEVEFTSYDASVESSLDEIGAAKQLSKQSAVLIKPNLINGSPHPVTTPVSCCEAIVRYIRDHSSADIVLAEGCGDSIQETGELFELHGYTELARRYGIEVLDLNHAPLVAKRNRECSVFPEMLLPEIAFTHYIISVPVLKAHSFSVVTGTLKNMMGFAPPKHYSGRYGTWKKAVFHQDIHQSISDLCRYVKPNLTVMDATIGLADFHLGGTRCSPPVNRIIAGFDPFEVDRRGAEHLGFDWRDIPHLKG